MNKSKIEKRPLEPLPGNEQKADGLPSSPAIANTHVIGSQCPQMSLDDAISELSVKAKEVTMELWLAFLMKSLKSVDGFYEWFDKTYKSNFFSIVAKLGDGFYVDLAQLRSVFNKMRGYEIKDRKDALT